MSRFDIGLFMFRAVAIISLAGAVLEVIERNWMVATIFFSLGAAAALLVALAATEGEAP